MAERLGQTPREHRGRARHGHPAPGEGQPRCPTPRVLRTALYSWAFRLVLDQDGELVARVDAEEAPEAIVAALDWIGSKSVDISALNTPTVVRSALDALARKMDGTAAADNTVNRKVPVFSNCLRYAVELDCLPSLPLTKVDWTAPETDDEIDFRYVPGPQADRCRGRAERPWSAPQGVLRVPLLRGHPSRRSRGSPRVGLHSARGRLGPSHLVVQLPSRRLWLDRLGGVLRLPGLKKRARKATREVPIPPVLVRLIRDHIAEFGTSEDGRLVRAARGGGLLSKECGDTWKAARLAALTPHEIRTPLDEVPYGLRAAGVSLWLESGVSPAEVARRAGHSIAVLFRFYAKAIHRSQQNAIEKIERALETALQAGP